MSGLSSDQIVGVIDGKREVHTELSRALSWPALLRVCQREGVRVRVSKGPIPRLAQLVPFDGTWTIVISRDAPSRRHTYLVAHELGHLWLHHDRTAERWEQVYNMDVDWADDPREDDAELFAQLILMGPQRSAPLVQPTHVICQPARPPVWETPTQRAVRLGKLHSKAGTIRRKPSI
jgi:hypothetical protein